MDRLPALPIIKLPMSELGGVGKTDFRSIWIASELNEKEAAVIQTHEESHVWLWHKARAQKLPNYNHELWNVATDMEIARNIYTADDIEVIKAPRSRLSGSIVPDSMPDMPPNLVFAEEIYNWLQESAEALVKGWDCSKDGEDGMMADSNDSASNDYAPSEEELRESVARIKKAKAEEQARKDREETQRQAQEQVSSRLGSLTRRIPSLAEEMSAGLRVRHERPRSYARPSRRESVGFLSKGRKILAMPPLVEVFIDRSGSFSAEKTRVANDAVKLIISRYGASIRHDTFYFGNGELRDEDKGSGGNTPYHLILQHLQNSKPRIAIVVTDDDGCEVNKIPLPKQTQILCVPVGCLKTDFAKKVGGKDVTIN